MSASWAVRQHVSTLWSDPRGRGAIQGHCSEGVQEAGPSGAPRLCVGSSPRGRGTLGPGKQGATSTRRTLTETPDPLRDPPDKHSQGHTQTEGARKARHAPHPPCGPPHPRCSLAFSAHTQAHCPAAPATCPNTLHTHHPAKAPTCLHTGFLLPLGPHTPCRQNRGNFPQHTQLSRLQTVSAKARAPQ